MNFKISRMGAAVPLVVLGVLGYTSAAKAAVFTETSQLNIAGAFQLNAGNANGDADPGSEAFGDGDVFSDILFAPTLPEGFTGDPSTFLGTTDNSINAGNLVLDVDSDANGSLDRNALPGDLGEILATGGNTGAFANIAPGTLGLFRNFDLDGPVTGTSANDFFLEIETEDGSGEFFRFSLDLSSIDVDPDTFEEFIDPSLNPDAEIDFAATGIAVAPDGETSRATYDITAQFLFDTGVGGDPVAGDLITGIGSFSGSVIVEEQDIPESSTLLALVAIGGVFLSHNFRRKRAHKIN